MRPYMEAVSLGEDLPQMIMRVAWGEAGKLAEHRVAEALVEAARLKIEGAEPCAATSPLDSPGLRSQEQFAAEPAATQLLGDPESVDEQPLPHRRPIEAAHERAIARSERQIQRLPVAFTDVFGV